MPIRIGESLVMAVMIMLAGCSGGMDAGQAVERARAALDGGAAGAALADLRTALTIDADHREARQLLAEVYYGFGDLSTARLELDRVMRGGADELAIRLLDARLKLRTGEAAAVLAAIEAGGFDDAAEETRALLHAEALVALGRGNDARALLSARRQEAADDYAAADLLARLELAEGRLDAAVALSGEVTSAAPSFGRGWTTRGQALVASGAIADAIAAFERAGQELRPQLEGLTYLEALIGLTQARLAGGDAAGAAAALDQVRALAPSSLPVLRMDAALALRTGRLQDATTVLHQILTLQPDDIEAQFLLGSTHLQRGFLGQAEIYLARVVAARPEHLPARELLAEVRRAPVATGAEPVVPPSVADAARLADAEPPLREAAALLQAGDSAGARAVLERVTGAERTAAQVALAQVDLLGADAERARERLDAVLAVEPRHLAALLARGRVALATEGAGAARSWLDRAAAVDPSNPATLALRVDVAAAEGQLAEALRAARAIADSAPEDPLGHRLVGAIAVRMGANLEAVRALRRAIELRPDATDVRIMLAGALVAAGDAPGAERELDGALEREPQSVPATVAKARLLTATGRLDAALPLAEALVRALPERFEPLLLKAELLGSAGRWDEAAGALASAVDNGAGEAGVVRLYQARTRLGAAQPERLLLDWLVDHPDSVAVRYALAVHYQLSARPRDAAEHYRELIAVQPGNAIFHNNLALVSDQIGDPAALGSARRAHELAPDNGEITDTLGWMLMQGNPRDGLALLETAMRQAPGVPEIRYHLAAAHAEHGDRDRAAALLDELLAEEAMNAAVAEDAAALRARLERDAP